MFTQFASTADTISKASTLVFRIGTDAHLYDDPDDVNLAPLLDSRFDTEKCEALKRLLALIAQGVDVSSFFPRVVKNVASQSLEVKKLVYLYLLHYAEKRPNEALLSINCFQKDLVDTNPLVRAWALRTMAGIRLHVIAPLVLVAVSKSARDASVYVRKCAAYALSKLNDLQQEQNTCAVEEIIGILLNDNSPGVVGAAASAFNSICPNNLSLIGRNYARLCELLPDVEEWGQITLVGLLLRYVIAKHGLVKESIMGSSRSFASNYFQAKVSSISCMTQESVVVNEMPTSEMMGLVIRSYIEGPDEYFSRTSHRNGPFSGLNDICFTSAESNNDVRILLKCTSPMLWSHNSAVVLAAAGVHWIIAPKDQLQRIAKPLLFLLRSSCDSNYIAQEIRIRDYIVPTLTAVCLSPMRFLGDVVRPPHYSLQHRTNVDAVCLTLQVLCNILIFCKTMPSLFSTHYEDFFISASDTYQIKALKLEILATIATESSMQYIFQEFQDYVRDPDRRFAADTVAAIGLCGQRAVNIANTCLEGLLSLIRQESFTGEQKFFEEEARVLVQAVLSIKKILEQEPARCEKVIIQLVRSLDFIKVAGARAAIIWILGEYNSLGERIPKVLTTVLKYLAHCFTSEMSETKLQILGAAAKVLLYAKGEDHAVIRNVVAFILKLAKHDLNYDVRDRAQFLNKLLAGVSESQDESSTSACKKSPHVAERIFSRQRDPIHEEPANNRFYLPGSLSLIVLHAAPSYEPLPKPSSLPVADNGQLSDLGRGMGGSDDSETSPGSVNEHSSSGYGSQQSISGSSFSDSIGENESLSDSDRDTDPLVQLSDDTIAYDRQDGNSSSINTLSAVWRSRMKHIVSSDQTSSEDDYSNRSLGISNAYISSLVKPKSYTLLDSVNGNGLKIEYSFTSQISDISPLLVCIDVCFQNCSSEAISEMILVVEESDKGQVSTETESVAMERASPSHNEVPTLFKMKEIDLLEAGEKANRIIEVRFHHHLLPLKLALWCNNKKHSVKLRPDIGYFVKPLVMDVKEFLNKEAKLPGMFEYVRSCTFSDHVPELQKDEYSQRKDVLSYISQILAVKMLSNTNFFLVSVDVQEAVDPVNVTGLCLRFSSEILSSGVPCLITITAGVKSLEPLNVSVKVNCEETVFGLNLLNRVVNFLAELSSS
ncbi:AP3-complex subunit beta-A-like protein [Drosera capensis]